MRLCATYMRVKPRRHVPRMFVVLRVPEPPPPPGLLAIFDAPTERYPMHAPQA